MLDLHMIIYVFCLPMLLLITFFTVKTLIESRQEYKQLQELADEGRRNNVKPIDEY